MAPSWDRDGVGELLARAGVDAWGVAANAPPLPLAPSLPTAVALLKRFAAHELLGVEDGPHETYYAGYRRLNAALDAAAVTLVEALRAAGFQAEHVPPTVPEELYESIDDWGDAGVFAHKTAATRAGLGWIGKTALFVSSDFGPRVRLATVFTDLTLEAGTPVVEGRCGLCRRCVDACPAGAGRDVTWRAGLPRDTLYDEKACEAETERYPHLGGVCGVCIAVCPWGREA
jgi:epoxyqueuosine reductase QueG